MKVKVLEKFFDKQAVADRNVGDMFSCSEERATELIEYKLVEKVAGEYNSNRDVELTIQIQDLKAREISVGAKEVELTQKEENLNKREIELNKREDSLTTRDNSLNGIGGAKTAISIDLTKQWQQVIADVKECADLDVLEQALKAEKANDKPRPSVSSAIQDRINELIEK